MAAEKTGAASQPTSDVVADLEDLKQLEAAAAGLSSAGVAAALVVAGVDPDRGLEGVPKSKLFDVCRALEVSFRANPTEPVSAYERAATNLSSAYERVIGNGTHAAS